MFRIWCAHAYQTFKTSHLLSHCVYRPWMFLCTVIVMASFEGSLWGWNTFSEKLHLCNREFQISSWKCRLLFPLLTELPSWTSLGNASGLLIRYLGSILVNIATAWVTHLIANQIISATWWLLISLTDYGYIMCIQYHKGHIWLVCIGHVSWHENTPAIKVPLYCIPAVMV